MDTWERWHPLARDLARRLVLRSDPGLTDDELIELDVSLSRLAGRDLAGAVSDMFYLIAALEHEGFEEVAAQLLALLANRRIALDTGQRLRAIDRAEAVAARAKRFTAFARTPTPRASLEASHSERTVRVRDLLSALIV